VPSPSGGKDDNPDHGFGVAKDGKDSTKKNQAPAQSTGRNPDESAFARSDLTKRRTSLSAFFAILYGPDARHFHLSAFRKDRLHRLGAAP
jgi:hypothetical protein